MATKELSQVSEAQEGLFKREIKSAVQLSLQIFSP
jgi:hypothetical protein